MCGHWTANQRTDLFYSLHAIGRNLSKLSFYWTDAMQRFLNVHVDTGISFVSLLSFFFSNQLSFQYSEVAIGFLLDFVYFRNYRVIRTNKCASCSFIVFQVLCFNLNPTKRTFSVLINQKYHNNTNHLVSDLIYFQIKQSHDLLVISCFLQLIVQCYCVMKYSLRQSDFMKVLASMFCNVTRLALYLLKMNISLLQGIIYQKHGQAM